MRAGHRRSRSQARAITPNWPCPARTASKSSRSAAREHVTRSPAGVTTSRRSTCPTCAPKRTEAAPKPPADKVPPTVGNTLSVSTGTVNPVPCSASMTPPHGWPPPTSSTSPAGSATPQRRDVSMTSPPRTTVWPDCECPAPRTATESPSARAARNASETSRADAGCAILAGAPRTRPPKSRACEGGGLPCETRGGEVMSGRRPE